MPDGHIADIVTRVAFCTGGDSWAAIDDIGRRWHGGSKRLLRNNMNFSGVNGVIPLAVKIIPFDIDC